MKNEEKNLHSIITIKKNCTGCTRCLRVCPTEALRVRGTKVRLDEKRCIDCGQCVVTCTFDAVHTNADSLSKIDSFKHKIAIIPAAFAGQFPQSIGYHTAKKGLLHIGFDEVVEESMLVPEMNECIRNYLAEHKDIRPILSSNSPAVLKLIQAKFPSLLEHILYLEAPVSILARHAREQAEERLGLESGDIGVFLIASCVSQVTAVHHREGTYAASFDGAIAMRDVYCEIMTKKKEILEDPMEMQTYPSGLTWAMAEAEADDVQTGNLITLSVSGIYNVIDILTTIENQQLDYFDFIVLNSCTSGEVGGILNNENAFVAMSRIKEILRKVTPEEITNQYTNNICQEEDIQIPILKSKPIMQLDTDIKKSLQKIKLIKDIHDMLPGLDCSACGSPNCYALAEDVVSGKADISDCVVLLKSTDKIT